MSIWSAAYFHLCWGKGRWGESPPKPAFEEFKTRLSEVIAEFPTTLQNIPPDPDLTDEQWKALNDFFRWWRRVSPEHISKNRPVNLLWQQGGSHEQELWFWGSRVYRAFVGLEWERQLRQWKDRRHAILNSRRYVAARVVGALTILLLVLLPVWSVVDFSCVALSDNYGGVLWGRADVQKVRSFGEKILWLIPWETNDPYTHTRDMISLAALLFFPISWGLGLVCSGRTLWNAWDLSSLAEKELREGHAAEYDCEASEKAVESALQRMLGWSVVGAMLWWVPAVILAAIGFIILLVVAGIALTVGYSVKKGVSGRD